MLRFMLLCLSVIVMIVTGAAAGERINRDPPGMDRPGGDYTHGPLAQADPELCVRQCAADRRCSSFTYVRPGLQGAQAVCWLKSVPSRLVRSTCCQSGTKSFVADRAPGRPAEVQPPETLDKQWCTLGLICSSQKKGSWIDERRTCDCDPP